MFAGCVATSRDGYPAEPHALASALLSRLAPLHEPDAQGTFVGSGAVLAQALNWNTPESKREEVPARCPHTGRVAVSWMRLDNREALGRLLNIPTETLCNLTDPALLLECYRVWGLQTASHLEGDFAFAILDPARSRLYMARDPMGIRPLYFARGRGLIAFTTTLAALHAIPGVDTTFSQSWMAFHLAGLTESTEGLTPMTGVVEVLPGHAATVMEGRVHTTRYHQLKDDAPWSVSRDEGRVDAYRKEFLRAVGVRMRSDYTLGAENSGGLDTASIIAAAHALGGSDLRLETFGIPLFTVDERCMRHAVEGTGYRVRLFTRTGIDEQMMAALAATKILGHPPELNVSYYWNPFVKWAAAQGARTILSGNGGDDAVTNSGDLFLRELVLRREWRLLIDMEFGRSLPGLLRAAKFIARQHLRRRRNLSMVRSSLHDLQARGLSQAAIHDLGLWDFSLKLAEWTTPYDSLNGFLIGYRLVGHPALRAAESCQVAFSDKVEYRYPMLDARLIQAYLSTPSIEKRGPRQGRYLHRRAMTGLVPDEIRGLARKDGHPGARVTWGPSSEPFNDRVTPGDILGTRLEGLVDIDELRRNSIIDRGKEVAGDDLARIASEDFHFRLMVLLRSLDMT